LHHLGEATSCCFFVTYQHMPVKKGISEWDGLPRRTYLYIGSFNSSLRYAGHSSEMINVPGRIHLRMRRKSVDCLRLLTAATIAWPPTPRSIAPKYHC
jgi:hypothetical protein